MSQGRKIALLGAAGQLGCAVKDSSMASTHELISLDRERLDVTCEEQVYEVLGGIAPDVVVNAAAYTAVDKAETDEQLAYAVNAKGPELIGQAARRYGFKVIHISTDFVFDGLKSSPYHPKDKTNPLSVYGRTKLAGEQALQRINGVDVLIVRTSWLYSIGHPCFLSTMLKLMASKPSLGIIADQVGSPTCVRSLAEVVWRLAELNTAPGVYHWADAGVASWYDFAQAIQSSAVELGILNKSIPIKPLATSEYPTLAKRPAYSVMDKRDLYKLLGIEVPPDWRSELNLALKQMVATVPKRGI